MAFVTDHSGIVMTVSRTCPQMANVIILAVGYNNKDVEREGADHSYTTLPGLQTNLTNAVIAAGKLAAMIVRTCGLNSACFCSGCAWRPCCRAAY